MHLEEWVAHDNRLQWRLSDRGFRISDATVPAFTLESTVRGLRLRNGQTAAVHGPHQQRRDTSVRSVMTWIRRPGATVPSLPSGPGWRAMSDCREAR